MENKETLIIMGGRGSGRTLRIIRESAKTGCYILVANKKRAEYLFKFAKECGYDIPYPVTPEEYYCNHFTGSSIERDGMYVDDVDDVFKSIFRNIDIRGVSFCKTDNIEDLGESKWPKENPYLRMRAIQAIDPDLVSTKELREAASMPIPLNQLKEEGDGTK